jgi:hypothetical protein
VDYDDGAKVEKRSAILREMISKVEAIHGVEVAGVTDNLLLDRNRGWGLWAKGKEFGRTALIMNSDTRVIGVISDVREDSVKGEAGWQIYLSASQFGPSGACSSHKVFT